jgi:hypothetical protein
MVISPEHLDALAGQLRADYMDRVNGESNPARQGSHGGDTERWRAVARIVHKLGADPLPFMDAAFEKADAGSRQNGKRSAPHFTQLTNQEWCREAWLAAETSVDHGDMSDFETTAESEWWLIKHMNSQWLMRRTGSVDPLNPQVIALLRDRYSQIPAIFRTVFSANDPVVLELCGDEAREYLRIHKAVAVEIVKDGLELPPPK